MIPYFNFPPLLPIAVNVGANFYLYKWLVRSLRPSGRWLFLLRLAFVLLVILFPTSKVLGKYEFNSFSHLLSFISSMWMGACVYWSLLAAGLELLLRYSRIQKNLWSPFQRRVWVLGIFLIALAICADGYEEARNVQITRMEVPLRNLPAELDGLSIVQLSDIHYGMINENGRLSKIVQQANGLHPDIIVITGDLVDENVSHMEEMASPLSNLNARIGVFGITGNHEYFAGVERVVSIMRRAGIQVLLNEKITLPGGLQILGIDDPTYFRRMKKPLPDFDKMIHSVDPQKPSILLYHQPIQFDQAAAAGIGLQLSGHTHGPQMWPLWPFAKILFPHTRGLYQAGESYLYVSRGIGTGGPPMRNGSPPELVYIRLKATQG